MDFDDIIALLISSDIFLGLALVILLAFVIILGISVWKNRTKISPYSLIMRNGKLSKVGITFIIVLPLIVWELIHEGKICEELIYILMIIFGTEIGFKYMDRTPTIGSKRISKSCREDQIDTINNLK